MEITLIINLHHSFSGVLYGLQQGTGSNYKTIQKQEGGQSALNFTCEVACKKAEGHLNFLGPFCHGTPKERFVYIDIGTYSSITDSISGGRLNIPLYGISQEIIAAIKEGSILQTSVSALGESGRPAYGTVKPFEGWSLV
jgi:hypothetical protein